MTVSKYLLAMLLVSCAGASKNEVPAAGSETSASDEPDVPPPPQCLGEDGKTAECSDDRDCCPNYYCGKDPEGSHLKRFCLYSGSQ